MLDDSESKSSFAAKIAFDMNRAQCYVYDQGTSMLAIFDRHGELLGNMTERDGEGICLWDDLILVCKSARPPYRALASVKARALRSSLAFATVIASAQTTSLQLRNVVVSRDGVVAVSTGTDRDDFAILFLR